MDEFGWNWMWKVLLKRRNFLGSLEGDEILSVGLSEASERLWEVLEKET